MALLLWVLVLFGVDTVSATETGTPSATEGQLLYRCLTLDHADHFVSPSADCEGTTTEQVLGCTAPSDAPTGTTVSLLRCFNGTDHMVSTDTSCPLGNRRIATETSLQGAGVATLDG